MKNHIKKWTFNNQSRQRQENNHGKDEKNNHGEDESTHHNGEDERRQWLGGRRRRDQKTDKHARTVWKENAWKRIQKDKNTSISNWG